MLRLAATAARRLAAPGGWAALPPTAAAPALLRGLASRAAAPGGGGGEAGAGTGGKGELEPYLEALLGQREAAEDLLVRHPELGAGGKATPAAAQRSMEALEGAGLSLKTIRALVRSCPRLLWRGPELAQVVAGTAPLPPGAQGLRPQSWLQEEFKLKGPEPDYPGFWVPDYDPVHSSVTGVPCKWVGGPRPPVDLFVDRLLQLTVLAHALPASDDEWSDDEG